MLSINTGVVLSVVACQALLLFAEEPLSSRHPDAAGDSSAIHRYGPGDTLSIWAFGLDEIGKNPVQIDSRGDIDLPLLGTIHASGLTGTELRAALLTRLQEHVREPQVSVNLLSSKSQPVSVIGGVNTPGVYQLQSGKTLVEALSGAGGLRSDAGHSIKITRLAQWGPLPLPDMNAEGGFLSATVKVKELLEGRNPSVNIQVRPGDVISVPRAEMVYVVGEVTRAGGFVLNDNEHLSVLKALSLAGGLTRNAARKHARILRDRKLHSQVDLSPMLAGKAPDMPLLPDDVLFVPDSKAKTVTSRAIETALGLATGMLIWR
jgi:polysaccharide export outer membrane protein